MERWSELEYVLKSGARKAVFAESGSLLHTLPLQEPSGCHSPCSSAGLWHNMHWCVPAHRHGASQIITLVPLATHSHRSSSGAPCLVLSLAGVCPSCWSVPGLAGAAQAARGKPQSELKAKGVRMSRLDM